MLLKRKKRRFKLPSIDVNVVPLMDILTTMLFFLLLVASFSNLSSLRVSMLSAPQAVAKKDKPEFKLGIALTNPNQIDIRLGPTQELDKVEPGRLHSYLNENFSGAPKKGYTKTLRARNQSKLTQRLQKTLIPIKKGFPHEMEAEVAVADSIRYQNLVDLLASIKKLDSQKEPMTLETLIGQRKQTNVLFPNLTIREIK